MRWEHPRVVGQAEKLLVEGSVEETPEGSSVESCPARRQKVGTPDVANEEGVASQYAVGRPGPCLLVDHHADGLRRMARRSTYLQAHLPEVDALAVVHRLHREVDLCTLAERDHGTGGCG